MPQISVVMPVLNAAPYLAESIESILTQTLGDLEFVIVDDGSDDGSQDLIADYAKRDRRIRTLFLQRSPDSRSGARGTREGVAIATAPLIARMDGDDIALPHKLQTQLAYMQTQGIDVCGADMEVFGETAGIPDKTILFPQSHEAMRREILFRPIMPHPTMVFAAEIFRAVAPREDVHAEDYVWQTQLIRKYRLGNVPEVLLHNRRHAAQLTSNHNLRFRLDMAAARLPYLFAEWPEARMADFLAISRVADRVPFASLFEVEMAGAWLVKLADHSEARLRTRMARRWRESEYLLAELAQDGATAIFTKYKLLLDQMAAGARAPG